MDKTLRNKLHPGEQAVQKRLGVEQEVLQWAPQAIRSFMPDQHRDFFAQLPFMVMAARDASGSPWATLLAGVPGFTVSPDPQHLRVQTKPVRGDATDSALIEGAEIGLLGIELETRRRNRVNGPIVQVDDKGFTLEVAQSFGNCPQYISKRKWQAIQVEPSTMQVTRHTTLTEEMRGWIAAADTLFIASGYDREETGKGMDVSHRGGPAGFVKLQGTNQLVLPDYAGNNLFNTIGNLLLDPRVGLLFIDFDNGSLLQMTGKATIDWDSPAVARHPGAQRLVIVTIEAIIELNHILPLRWSEPEGHIRELRVERKVAESDDVVSLELASRDGGALPVFRAGQYLPLEIQLGGDPPIERTYSLSNAPQTDRYRISVKREPQGLVSRLLHDQVGPGDIMTTKDPEGEFVLTEGQEPVTLISAGIGITPMVSMLYALTRQQRPVYFIHGARNGAHLALLPEVRALASAHDHIHLTVLFSRPGPEDQQGEDYHRSGRISGELIEEIVPQLEGDFYLCGPKPFLSSIEAQLLDKGVDLNRIHSESF